MEFSDVASYFDNQPVSDAYTGAFLFDSQPDLFDASTRDAEAGWRRTLSAASVVMPARRCINFGGDIYVAGRSVKDFFQGEAVREYVLLHPADGLFTYGSPAAFLAAAGTTSFYAGMSWVKERKTELLTSETTAIYDVYCSAVEPVSRGMLVLSGLGRYLRVHGIDTRSGGLAVLVAYDLGASALRQVSYSSAGAYSVSSDSSTAGAPNSVAAIVEDFSSNYRYRNNAADTFARADKVVTVLKTAVTSPKPGDKLVDNGTTYRVISRADDGLAWELHVRPI